MCIFRSLFFYSTVVDFFFYLYHCFWFDKRSSDFGLCFAFAFATPVCRSQCSNILSHTVFNVSSKRRNHTTKHEKRRMESLQFVLSSGVCENEKDRRRVYTERKKIAPYLFQCFTFLYFSVSHSELKVFFFDFSFPFLQLHLQLSHFIQHSFV